MNGKKLGIPLCFSACLCVFVANCFAAGRDSVDPQALAALHRMAAAYARLSSMKQESRLSFTISPIAPDSSPKTPTSPVSASSGSGEEDPAKQPRQILIVAQPNRLLFQREQFDSRTNRQVVSRWVSDGKTFWTYSDANHWYTKEKAPAHLRDFLRLPHLEIGSLEMVMALGMDPFDELQAEAETVRSEGTTRVGDVETEVVLLRSRTPGEITEMRLYIGKTDSLLHRMVTETTPIVAPAVPGKIGDGLDALLDMPLPQPPAPPDPDIPPDIASARDAPSPSSAVKTRISYDNNVTVNPTLGPQDFLFAVPSDASLYQPPANSNAARRGKGNSVLQELVKTLKSQYKKNHPKPAQ